MEGFASTAFLYRYVDLGIKILKCRSLDTSVEVPEMIAQTPVVELGAYAFSADGRGLEDGRWTEEEEAIADIPELSGNRLTRVHLPESLRKIGLYAFYNCENLKSLYFYSTTLDWGGGAFTGCRGIRFLDVQIKEGEKSCLKEILSELHQTLYVVYHGKQEARLVFPEFYEEAVENTPARILETHTHGCGHQYRYCFEESQFQFGEYDSLFAYVQVQESEELVLELTEGRLRYGYGLSDACERMYWNYLSQHRVAAALYAVCQRDMIRLKWLVGQDFYDSDELAKVIEKAGKLGDGAMISFLMNIQHQKGTLATRKRFQL